MRTGSKKLINELIFEFGTQCWNVRIDAIRRYSSRGLNVRRRVDMHQGLIGFNFV
jgi:hypothetical protein